MIEMALISILNSDPAITDVISGRIYPLYLPQSVTLPAVVYQQIGSPGDYTNDGPTGMRNVRLQLTCWAAAHVDAVNLAADISDRLSGHYDTAAGIADTHIESIGDIPYIGAAEQADRYGRYIDVVIVYGK